MANRDLTTAQLKKAWLSGKVVGVVAIEDAVRFVFAQGDADGYLLNSHGQIRRFPTHHQAWKWIDNLKGNEPDPY